MSSTMARKQKQVRQKKAMPEVVEPKPRVTTYVPPPCTACTAVRPEGESYSRVETTRGRIRYVRCGFCGNVFKHVE